MEQGGRYIIPKGEASVSEQYGVKNRVTLFPCIMGNVDTEKHKNNTKITQK